jgi:hypothetical protein
VIQVVETKVKVYSQSLMSPGTSAASLLYRSAWQSYKRDAPKMARDGWYVVSQSDDRARGPRSRHHITVTYRRDVEQPTPTVPGAYFQDGYWLSRDGQFYWNGSQWAKRVADLQ